MKPKPQAAPRSQMEDDVEFCMSLIQRELAQQAEDDDPDYQEARNTFDRIRPLLEAAPEMVELLEMVIAFGRQREITGSDAVDWISNVAAQQAKAIIRKAQPRSDR